MNDSKEWFSADKQGMKSIQMSKPKFYAIREILANCFDEMITKCVMDTFHERGVGKFIIEDDSPQGFRDLSDSYTLFKDCYKRPFADKRGRYNLGNKQAFSICETASIETTTGIVTFDKDGRHQSRLRGNCRDNGTKVEMAIKMSKQEYDEILTYVRLLIIPQGIQFTLNGEHLPHRQPIKELYETLMTEYLDGEHMVRSQRKTGIHLYEPEGTPHLFELGIPICTIDCKYSVDVTQRVPMSSDRDTVSQAYLQDLFAIILNATFDDLKPEESSALWVRDGMSDERVHKDAVQQVIRQRYGDKVVVATPNDPLSVDDALAHGYRVITGAELSASEWSAIRKAEAVSSSHELFGHGIATDCKQVEPDENMRYHAVLAATLIHKVYGLGIGVDFVKSRQMTAGAFYGGGKLTFNMTTLGKDFFKPEDGLKVSKEAISLILHETAHSQGMHTEASYHEAITRLGSELVIWALNEPELFKDLYDDPDITSDGEHYT